MLVKRKGGSWLPFHERILIEATEDKKYSADSFLGERVWTLEKGDQIFLRVKKSEMIEAGDKIRFDFCVHLDWKRVSPKIPWDWEYNMRSK